MFYDGDKYVLYYVPLMMSILSMFKHFILRWTAVQNQLVGLSGSLGLQTNFPSIPLETCL
jgi:hypothetical protein